MIFGRRRYEQENKTFLVQIEDFKIEIETLTKAKSQALSTNKELEARATEMRVQIDDAIRQAADANAAKSRSNEENLACRHRLETTEFELASVEMNLKRTQADLEEVRLQLESEMAVRDHHFVFFQISMCV